MSALNLDSINDTSFHHAVQFKTKVIKTIAYTQEVYRYIQPHHSSIYLFSWRYYNIKHEEIKLSSP